MTQPKSQEIFLKDNNTIAKKKLKFHLQGRNLKIVPALVGLTGIGKTAIVNQVAKELGYELIYFNMAQQNEGDNAIPVPKNMEKEDANIVYILHHKFQEILKNPDKKYIVFADEFTRAQITVISEWMTIINERQFQGHKFGENVRFIAAMNPTTSMKGFSDTDYASTEMDDAHAARFTFIYMEADRTDWLDWARKNDIHPSIISFLEDAKNTQYFYGQAQSDIRMRTPRTWEFLSDQLYDIEDQNLKYDGRLVTGIITDQIGDDIGSIFANHYKTSSDKITFEDVIRDTDIPTSIVARFRNFTDIQQIETLKGICEQIEKNRDNNIHLTPIQADNFMLLWENLHKEDAKLTIGKALDNAVLKYDEKYLEENIEDLDLTKPLPLHPECVLEKLYKRQEYAKFMLAIHEAVGERVPDSEVA